MKTLLNVAIVVILGASALIFSSRLYQDYKTRLEVYGSAVQAGVGEWVIEYNEPDFSDVKRSFRWKVKP